MDILKGKGVFCTFLGVKTDRDTLYSTDVVNGNMTMLEAELVTGKTHQIRIHLAGIGHPVLGDYKYGYFEFNDLYKKKYGIHTQLLHASRLEFPKMDGEWEDMSELVLKAEPPEIFRLSPPASSYSGNS